MLAPKYRENLKVGFITFALSLMLFTEPLLAEKGRRGGDGRGDGPRGQPAAGGSSAPTPKGASVSVPSPKVSTPAPSVPQETRSGASNSANSNSPPTISNSGGRQPTTRPVGEPDRIVTISSSTPAAPPVPQPDPVISNPQAGRAGGSRHITRQQPTISNSAGTPPVGSSSNEGCGA